MTEQKDVSSGEHRNQSVVVTDAMVDRLRESLWSTWGEGRQTTDWPSDKQLRQALHHALAVESPAVEYGRSMKLARRNA